MTPRKHSVHGTQLRDELGNALTDMEATLRVRLQCPSGDHTAYATVRSIGGGWYRGQYCVTKAGAWALAAEVEGIQLRPPLQYVVVLAAPVHPPSCSVAVREATGCTVEWEVVLRDVHGNKCDAGEAGEAVRMEAWAGGQPLLPVSVHVDDDKVVGGCVLPDGMAFAVVDVMFSGARLRGCPVGVDRRERRQQHVLEDVSRRWKEVLNLVDEKEVEHQDDVLPAGVPVVHDLKDLWLIGRLRGEGYQAAAP